MEIIDEHSAGRDGVDGARGAKAGDSLSDTPVRIEPYGKLVVSDGGDGDGDAIPVIDELVFGLGRFARERVGCTAEDRVIHALGHTSASTPGVGA